MAPLPLLTAECYVWTWCVSTSFVHTGFNSPKQVTIVLSRSIICFALKPIAGRFKLTVCELMAAYTHTLSTEWSPWRFWELAFCTVNINALSLLVIWTPASDEEAPAVAGGACLCALTSTRSQREYGMEFWGHAKGLRMSPTMGGHLKII